MDRLLTIKELAEMTGLHVVTLRQWTSAGKLPYVKLSPKVVRYPLSKIDAWIKSKEVDYGSLKEVE